MIEINIPIFIDINEDDFMDRVYQNLGEDEPDTYNLLNAAKIVLSDSEYISSIIKFGEKNVKK